MNLTDRYNRLLNELLERNAQEQISEAELEPDENIIDDDSDTAIDENIPIDNISIDDILASRQPRYYINQYNESFVVLNNDPNETGLFYLNINDDSFQVWLQYQHLLQNHSTIIERELRSFVRRVQTEASMSNSRYNQPIRYASSNENGQPIIFIDTRDSRNRVIRIDSNGWRYVDQHPYFMRFNHQRNIPEPTVGDIRSLFNFIPIVPNERVLFLAYLVTCLLPINKPSLSISSESGHELTQAIRFIKTLIDPSTQIQFELNDSPRNRVNSAREHYWLPYNNIIELSSSHISFLNQITSGLTDRYNNQSVTITRDIAIKNIDSFNLPAELRSRFLSFTLNSSTNANVIGEQALQTAFEETLPSLLGALYSILSRAIVLYPSTETVVDNTHYRDFSRWTHAIVRAYIDLYDNDYLRPNTIAVIDNVDCQGLSVTDALNHYRTAFEEMIEDAHSHRPEGTQYRLADILVRFIRNQPEGVWQGNYDDTMQALRQFFLVNNYPLTLFPRSGTFLGSYLASSSIREHFQHNGIEIIQSRQYYNGRQQRIIICRQL